jgi:hypothetical protein
MQYIQELEDLAQEYRAAKTKIQQLEDEVKKLKASQYKLQTETLPDAMLNLGLLHVTLATGDRISIDMEYESRLLKTADGKTIDREKTGQFYQWLMDNGFAGLVQSVFEVWTKDPAVIMFLQQACKINDIPFEYRQRDIHWKTLESWFEEQTKKNTKLPLELFQHWIGRKATIK